MTSTFLECDEDKKVHLGCKIILPLHTSDGWVMLPSVLGVDLVISNQHSMINPKKRQRRETFPPLNVLQKLILHIAQAYLIKQKKITRLTHLG